MQIGLIGYGAVAALHAQGLGRWGADLRTVYGPDRQQARTFALSHRIPQFTAQLETAISGCEIAIIASPSNFHFEQALSVMERQRHCLVELPACGTGSEARHLMGRACESKVILQCAHTSRYLPGIIQVEDLLNESALGEIRQVISVRAIPPRTRDWIDDALLHHAAHHVDLMLHWFGELEPVACIGHPQLNSPQELTLAARLPAGAPVSINVSYSSRMRETRLTIVGSRHTIHTDGFSFIESDEARFTWHGDAQQSYEAAIERQDRAFVGACVDGIGGIPWTETIRLTECVDAFRTVGLRSLKG